MLKQIKETNEKILKKHFEQALGGGHSVDVKWGFPFIEVAIKLETEASKTIIRLNFNSETEDYSISSYASKTIEGKEVPDFAGVDKALIDYIITSSSEITEQFFTTKNYDPDAKIAEEVSLDEEKEESVDEESEPRMETPVEPKPEMQEPVEPEIDEYCPE